MTPKLSFKFSFKITSPYRTDLPPEVAELYAKGSTLIAAWRKYYGFTPKEVAKRAGILRGTYHNQESGMHKPREQNLKKIAAALGVTFSQLID